MNGNGKTEEEHRRDGQMKDRMKEDTDIKKGKELLVSEEVTLHRKNTERK